MTDRMHEGIGSPTFDSSDFGHMYVPRHSKPMSNTKPTPAAGSEELSKKLKAAYELARAATATEEGRKAIDFFYHVHLNNYPGFAYSVIAAQNNATYEAVMEAIHTSLCKCGTHEQHISTQPTHSSDAEQNSLEKQSKVVQQRTKINVQKIYSPGLLKSIRSTVTDVCGAPGDNPSSIATCNEIQELDEIMAAIRQYAAKARLDALQKAQPTHLVDGELQFGIDPASPNGDMVGLSINHQKKMYAYTGEEAEALLAWRTAHLRAAVRERDEQIVKQLTNHQNSSVGLVIKEHMKRHGLDHMAYVGIYRLALDSAVEIVQQLNQGEK